MTDQPLDPLALWRDLLAKWEAGVNEVANRNMASPEFSRFMNQAMGMSTRTRHGFGELMARYLEAMNMPSRADVAALGERLQGIEQQIASLNATVAHLAIGMSGAPMPPPGPPRTKRPESSGSAPQRLEAPLAAEVPAGSVTRAKPASKQKRRAKRGNAS